MVMIKLLSYIFILFPFGFFSTKAGTLVSAMWNPSYIFPFEKSLVMIDLLVNDCTAWPIVILNSRSIIIPAEKYFVRIDPLVHECTAGLLLFRILHRSF